MAKQRTGQDRPREGSPGQRKSRTRTSILAWRPHARNRSARSRSTRANALHVLSASRRDPKLTLTQAAKKQEASLRSIRGASVSLLTDLQELDRLGNAGVVSFESLNARSA